MIVVCDTSPILNLAAVGEESLLQALYGTLLIPPAVAAELRRNACEPSELSWLILAQPTDENMVRRLRATLDAGEAEAIALALEVEASRILIDEHRGRQFAMTAGLSVMGLLGVLAEAKQRNLIAACKPLLDRMIAEAGFWIGDRLYAEYMRRISE